MEVFLAKCIDLFAKVIDTVREAVVAFCKEFDSCKGVRVLAGVFPLTLMGEIMEMIQKLRQRIVLVHGMCMRRYGLLRMLLHHIVIETVELEYLLDPIEFFFRHPAFSVLYRR